MKTIKVEPWDPDNIQHWEQAAGSYLAAIKQNRDVAFAMLQHSDWVARDAAVKSFLYYWDFDLDIAHAFHALATNDEHVVVRFNAAAFLSLAHNICKFAEDRLFLESLLVDIAKAPGQDPDIVDEVQGYLEHEASDARATVPANG